MEFSIRNKFREFQEWTDSMADPRTKGWFLVDSPVPTLIAVATYLFIIWIGPKIMKHRKSFQLNKILVTHNLLMTALNLFICLRLGVAAFNLRYNLLCQPSRHIWNRDELHIASGVWWFYLSKCLHFMDTMYFILRKKDKQLSFLHVYHHSTIAIICWMTVKFLPTGTSFLPALVNSFIHVVMYLYYGLAAIGPQMHPYLWWKKYVTVLQLAQFIGTIIISINAIFIDCDYSLRWNYFMCAYMTSFLVLYKFYITKYCKDHQMLKQENKNIKNTEKELV